MIASQYCRDIKYDATSKYVLTGGIQQVLVFDAATSEELIKLTIPFDVHSSSNDYTELTCFDLDLQRRYVVAGFRSGIVYLFDYEAAKNRIRNELQKNGLNETCMQKSIGTFFGHKKGVNCIKFNRNCFTLFLLGL